MQPNTGNGDTIYSFVNDNMMTLAGSEHFVLQEFHQCNKPSRPPTAGKLAQVKKGTTLWELLTNTPPHNQTSSSSNSSSHSVTPSTPSTLVSIPESFGDDYSASVSTLASRKGVMWKKRELREVLTPDVVEFYDKSWQAVIRISKVDGCIDLVTNDSFPEKMVFCVKIPGFIEGAILQYESSGHSVMEGECLRTFLSLQVE